MADKTVIQEISGITIVLNENKSIDIFIEKELLIDALNSDGKRYKKIKLTAWPRKDPHEVYTHGRPRFEKKISEQLPTIQTTSQIIPPNNYDEVDKW